MKYSYKINEREIYNIRKKIQILNIEEANYLMINGEGNPGSEDFSKKVGALYQLSYKLKMKIFKEKAEFNDYVVYPLEGYWDLIDYTIDFSKDNLKYIIMIKQPSYITQEDLNKAKAISEESLEIKEVRLEKLTEGRVIQTTHFGSFDNEAETFAKMNEYMKEHNLKIKTKVHKEIYMSDFRRTKEENLKTILRYQLED